MLTIRPARTAGRDAIRSIAEPIIRSRDTYTLPRDMIKEDALLLAFEDHEVFEAEDESTNGAHTYLSGKKKVRKPNVGEKEDR
jgi:hypothetical protein